MGLAEATKDLVTAVRTSQGDGIPDQRPEADGKDPAAKALGRKGGAARARKLTAEQRTEIARKGAAIRWAKH
jgi:hypothetical protein